MSKKKESLGEVAQSVDLAAPFAEAKAELPVEVVIDEVDFNELADLQKSIKLTEEQFNKVAGSIKRLEKDLDVFYSHEKTLNNQIDIKRKELIKRYKINDQRRWQIEASSRKVVYQG
jgi:hypothetical protein